MATSSLEMSSSSSNVTGAEHYLVGISPQYWAHAPMHIADILHLRLVNGINCWCSAVNNNDDSSNDDDKTTSSFVPISKCLLVGCIVNAAIRSDGSITYVLDDGTGFIDCLQWSNNTANDIYFLPSLVEDDDDPSPTFRIGDLVRVFGKINCISTKTKDRPIREIQASLIEHVESPAIGGCSLDAEARHWMACVHFQASITKIPERHNAVGFLEHLGPQIQSQVKERMHLPASDDTNASWRVFGVSCRCNIANHLENSMASLLYCHCQAKVEPLDPEFVFRDALLQTLLEMQLGHTKKLVFTYNQIKQNQRLWDVASKLVHRTMARSSNALHFSVERLFLNSVRALRQDGILYLVDGSSDLYLLITREKVLEPYVRNELYNSHNLESRNFVNLQGAPFLSRVHHERLLYIKRCLQNEKRYRETAKAPGQ